MKHILLFCLMLLMSGCISSSPHRPSRYTRTPQEMAMINSSVVELVDREEGQWRTYCTGSFISRHRVLTAAHCVDQVGVQVHISLYGHEDDAYAFYVQAISDDSDLALLRKVAVGQPLPTHESLRVAMIAPEQGENVVVVGHPLGLGWTLTAGVVSSGARHGWDIDYEGQGMTRPLFIQHDAEVYFGNSGGVVLNDDNEIVGVVSQVHRVATHLAMSVHTDEIHDFLEGYTL